MGDRKRSTRKADTECPHDTARLNKRHKWSAYARAVSVPCNPISARGVSTQRKSSEGATTATTSHARASRGSWPTSSHAAQANSATPGGAVVKAVAVVRNAKAAAADIYNNCIERMHSQGCQPAHLAVIHRTCLPQQSLRVARANWDMCECGGVVLTMTNTFFARAPVRRSQIPP